MSNPFYADLIVHIVHADLILRNAAMQLRRQYFSVNNFQKSKPKNNKHFNGLPTKTWEPAHR